MLLFTNDPILDRIKLIIKIKQMKKILFVEDEPTLVEIYSKKLIDEGYEVKVCESGLKVQEEAEKFQPDIILLDMLLPDRDGFEVLEILKASPKTKKIRVVCFSNLGGFDDAERARNLGAEDYLLKSKFTPSELVREIQKRFSTPVSESVENMGNKERDLNNNLKVILFEDEDVFVEIFANALKEAGFFVDTAKTSKWASIEATAGNYSAILIDESTAGLQTENLINQIRSNDKTKNTPLFVITSKKSKQELEKIRKLGVNDVFEKTQVSGRTIAERVKNFTDKKNYEARFNN